MNKPTNRNAPKETQLIGTSQLDALADQLERWVKDVRLASDVAKSMDAEGLACYSWSSAEFGMKRLKSFMSALEDSRLASQMGKPIETGKLKPRSTAKKKAIVEEIKEFRKQTAKKRTAKPDEEL